MLTPLSRLINFRYRGPLESWKANQIRLNIAADISVLSKGASELEEKTAELGGLITTGEYLNVRRDNTVS